MLTKFNNDLKVNVEKTEKQKENWVEPNAVQNIYDEIKSKAMLKKSPKNKDSFENVLNYLIISLYTLQAPRRNIDYTLMKISSEMSDTKFCLSMGLCVCVSSRVEKNPKTR